MTDIAILKPSSGFTFDVLFNGDGFVTDDSLQTAVTISLFTDRRLPDSVENLDRSDDRRGYWGDVAELDGYQWGSLLWTMYRQVITAPVIASCREYCEQALQWMIDDGIAESVIVTSERAGIYQISIGVEIVKRDTRDTLRYSYLWSGDVEYPSFMELAEQPDPEIIGIIERWYTATNYTIPWRFS